MRNLFAAILFVSAAGPAAAEDYPHVYLKNDTLKVKVYLPDAEKGFYRGTRFDHAGVFGEVEFAGHKLFGPWKEKHDPTNHDDIVGPAEEFGMQEPLGYDEAKAGGTFLKIGVGELEKPKEDRYSFAKKYKVVRPAGWKKLDEVPEALRKQGVPTLMWQCEGSLPSGVGYQYAKALQIVGDKPIVLVYHVLKNTGTKPIATDFYNHNFFNVDGAPIGPDYSITFPFEAKAKDQKGKFGELVELKGKELRFKDKLTDGFVMAGLTGFDPEKVGAVEFALRHAPSGVKVEVTNGYRCSKLNVWGVRSTICPEPFMQIEGLKPGEGTAWAIMYNFEHDPPKK